jgi:16S rRNA processing protein RimM
VVVVLTTDRDERVAAGAQLFSDVGPLVVRSARGQRSGDSQRWIVQFEGYADRDSADRLRGQLLRAEPIDDPDELWAHDVVGAEVVLAEGEESVGRCVAVLANPAADLLELDSGALVPVVFVIDFVAGSDGDPGRVTIDPPPGLFEL